MTELNGSLDDVKAHVGEAVKHLNAALEMFKGLAPGVMLVNPDSLAAIKQAAQPVSGWVSDDRCGENEGLAEWQNRYGARPHTAHTYGRGNSQWCDGYI